MKPVVVPRPKAYSQASGRYVASWGTGLKRQTSHTIRSSWHMMAPDIALLFPSTVGNHIASSVASLATFAEIVRQKSVQSVVIWQTSISQLTAHTKAQWLSVPGLPNLSLTRHSLQHPELGLLRCRVQLHKSHKVPLVASHHRPRQH